MKYFDTMNRFLLSSVCLLMSSALWAGTISLETKVTATVQEGRLLTAVEVTNRGSEAAYNLQLKAELKNPVGESPVLSALPVGATHRYAFKIPLDGYALGRHVIVVRLLYADANGYPLSGLSISTFVIKRDSVPELLGILEPARVRTRGELTLKLKNLSGEAKSLRVRLVLPQELSSNSSLHEITLAGNEERRIAIPVRNFSALAGSAYPVVAVLEADRQALHSALPVMGRVEVLAPFSSGELSGRVFGGLAVVLAILIVFLNVRSFLPRR